MKQKRYWFKVPIVLSSLLASYAAAAAAAASLLCVCRMPWYMYVPLHQNLTRSLIRPIQTTTTRIAHIHCPSRRSLAIASSVEKREARYPPLSLRRQFGTSRR